MRSLIVKLLLLSLFLGCCSSGNSKNRSTIVKEVDSVKRLSPEPSDSIKFKYRLDSSVTYLDMKTQIKKVRSKIDTSLISTDSVGRLFTHLLLSKIFPYWYSTRWSFEGYTQTPPNGEIACGYFVSITLRDMGCNLNIYKMAQQLPVHEAMTLSIGVPIIEIENDTPQKNIDQIKNTLPDGLHFLGFDQMHVGYLLKEGKDVYLIHSNFIIAEGVTIENIDKSNAFTYVNRFYIAGISTNKQFMKKWLQNEALTIVTK